MGSTSRSNEATWKFAGVDIEFHNFGNLSSSSVDLKAHVDPSDSTPIVNISPEAQNQLPMPSKIVLTYIDRQTTNSRNLVGLDHFQPFKNW